MTLLGGPVCPRGPLTLIGAFHHTPHTFKRAQPDSPTLREPGPCPVLPFFAGRKVGLIDDALQPQHVLPRPISHPVAVALGSGQPRSTSMDERYGPIPNTHEEHRDPAQRRDGFLLDVQQVSGNPECVSHPDGSN
jgi:hypothetical protein